MPIFIALGKVTTEGMHDLDHLTARHEEAVKRVRQLGGRVISSYATMGRYDFVVTLDCPDMETAMRILNREAAGGNIKYETMAALPTRDFAQLFLDESSLADERTVLRNPRRRAGNTKHPRRRAGNARKPRARKTPAKARRRSTKK